MSTSDLLVPPSVRFLLRAKVFFLMFLLCADPLDAGDVEGRFRSEGLARLNELEQLTFRMKAKIREEQVDDRGKGVFVRRCCFKKDLLLSMYEVKWDEWDNPPPNLDKRPLEVVAGINSQYGFHIYRLKDRPFVIHNLDKSDKGPREIGPYRSDYARSISASWILDDRPFHEWITLDGFDILSVETVTNSGADLVKVKVDYSPDMQSPGEDGGRGFAAEVILDPDRYWCIQKVSYTMRETWQHSRYDVPKQVVIEYGTPVEGKPVPRLVTETFRVPPVGSVPGSYTTIAKIIDVGVTDDLEEDRFTLSRFGLPEPPGVEWERPTSWYIWLGLAGIGCIFLSAVLYWLKRRNNSAD